MATVSVHRYKNVKGKYRVADYNIWEDELMITPGMRIKAKRKELGLSQVQLAAMAGIKQSSLSELETGESKMPSAEALMGLSKALNVSKTWILTGKDGELEFLTQEEQLHIQSVRGLSAEQKRALYDLVSTFTGHKEE